MTNLLAKFAHASCTGNLKLTSKLMLSTNCPVRAEDLARYPPDPGVESLLESIAGTYVGL